MKFKCPLIVVKDIKESRKFYEDILGQKAILDFGAIKLTDHLPASAKEMF